MSAPSRVFVGSVVWDRTMRFNERSGALLNRTECPGDLVEIVVLWRVDRHSEVKPSFVWPPYAIALSLDR